MWIELDDGHTINCEKIRFMSHHSNNKDQSIHLFRYGQMIAVQYRNRKFPHIRPEWVVQISDNQITSTAPPFTPKTPEEEASKTTQITKDVEKVTIEITKTTTGMNTTIKVDKNKETELPKLTNREKTVLLYLRRYLKNKTKRGVKKQTIIKNCKNQKIKRLSDKEISATLHYMTKKGEIICLKHPTGDTYKKAPITKEFERKP